MSRVVAGLFATLASACFAKPDPPSSFFRTDGGGSATKDGRATGDGATGNCTVHDDFEAFEAGCGAWADTTVGGMVDIKHDTTTLRMLSTGGGSAQCSSRDRVDIVNGARVQITGVVLQMYASTSFEVVDSFSSTKLGVRIAGQGDAVAAEVSLQTSHGAIGATAYLPQAMLWWKLRREVVFLVNAGAQISSTEIVAEYSADGALWFELARDNVGTVPFTSTVVHLQAYFPSSSNYQASFDNLDACQ